jgi:hypothetical protein
MLTSTTQVKKEKINEAIFPAFSTQEDNSRHYHIVKGRKHASFEKNKGSILDTQTGYRDTSFNGLSQYPIANEPQNRSRRVPHVLQ